MVFARRLWRSPALHPLAAESCLTRCGIAEPSFRKIVADDVGMVCAYGSFPVVLDPTMIACRVLALGAVRGPVGRTLFFEASHSFFPHSAEDTSLTIRRTCFALELWAVPSRKGLDLFLALSV